MKIENLRTLIKESIQDYIKEIDQAANEAAMDARITKCEEAIQMRETKLNNLKNLEEAADMLDETKVKMMEKEINELKKAKAKFEKQKEKMANKGKKKEVTTDAKTDGEASVDEADVTAEMDMGEKPQEEALNESFLKMQKLAGVITEGQYRKKLQMLNEEITVGGTYTASMPTSSDGKERIDVKVKVLGKDSSGTYDFIVTPLEDKDYTNPASGQQNRFEKGKQYGIETKFLK